jgi:hypothetical protein
LSIQLPYTMCRKTTKFSDDKNRNKTESEHFVD